MPPVTLSPVTPATATSVLALRVAPEQERFVSGVGESFVDAHLEPRGHPWIRVVEADGVPVGFVMVSWDVVPVPDELWGPFYLWRLLIDHRHQGRGYGTAAVRLVADAVREAGGDELLTSCGRGEGSPQPFYESLGFVPTGEVDSHGEVHLALDLRGGAS
ncbi:GNAT family N-acetyltransferase [Oryzobacter terrae]|uniref:GNAT family N-acetyltransferase n=1 Tax=Oryzobacter terrae TaxID=1620385 RepID=UPI00366DB84C